MPSSTGTNATADTTVFSNITASVDNEAIYFSDIPSLYPKGVLKFEIKKWKAIMDGDEWKNIINGKCYECREHKETVIRSQSTFQSKKKKYICEECL